MGPQIASSLSSFAAAPSVSKCCAMILAARIDVADSDMLGAVFLGADNDGDGKLSTEDLESALEDMSSAATLWWPWGGARDVDVDVEKVLSEADLDHTGGISYTEFIAACVHARYESF